MTIDYDKVFEYKIHANKLNLGYKELLFLKRIIQHTRFDLDAYEKGESKQKMKGFVLDCHFLDLKTAEHFLNMLIDKGVLKQIDNYRIAVHPCIWKHFIKWKSHA